MMIPGTKDDWTRFLADRGHEIRSAIVFATRLPLGGAPIGGAELARALWALPLAGLIIGIIAAAVYALAHRLGLTPWPAAALALAATLAVTGCLHEDGLADTIDGFGGGDTRERKLAIMRDSRIGVYGVCALAVSILIRAGALASLADPGWVAWALIAAHGAARATLPVFMHFIGPARADGLAHDAGQPSREQAIAAAVLGILILIVSLGFEAALIGAILLAIVVALMARLSAAQIGGQTGDVLGALEQASEIVILLVAVQ
jgi:adenosylcobinamide-GDP ribazoletransferase